MIPEKIGEQVKRDYKSVHYFPFGNEAGSSFVLTSDPFSYLQAWLDNQLNLIQRDKKKRKNGLIKAKYFTELSEGFYQASKQAKMPVRGTLLYYSLLNFAKAFLIVKGCNLETKTEHHGLSLPADSDTTLHLTSNTGDGISIFHEFAKLIGKPINNGDGKEITLIELLEELPEVHELGYALGLFKEKKRRFLPVRIGIGTNKQKNKLFYTLCYDKKFDIQMCTHKLEKSFYKDKLDTCEIEDKYLKCFKSKLLIGYTPSSDISWKMAYPKIVADINTLNISPMLTKTDGYRYYLNLEKSRLHRLSSMLAFAFYIGTVARYRPTLVNSILKGKLQPIITEAINSCAPQYFYILVSHITNQVCAIPMAKID